MSFGDLIRMALHNLWSRKLRTLLNLLGVVISCVMLTMTFAGTRGASDGVHNIINSSAQTRRFMIQGSVNRKVKPPSDAVEVSGNLSDERRERITDLLRDKWINANGERVSVNQETLVSLRSIANLAAIVPQGPLTVQLKYDDQSIKGSTVGIRLDDQGFKQRLVAGEMPRPDDPAGILIDEFAAYNMGYRGDDDLQDLIGKPLTLEIPMGRHALSSVMQMLPSGSAGFDLSETVEFIASVKTLVEQLDQTNLTDAQKQAIRTGLKRIATTKAPAPESGSDRTASTNSDSRENENVRVDSKGNKFLIRPAFVRGVVQRPIDDDLFGFLKFTGRESLASIYFNHLELEQIHFGIDGSKKFWVAVGEIDDVSHLHQVVDDVEDLGFRTRSAVRIVESLDREVNKAKLAIGSAALLILLIAAVGISNTMIIAVLERTQEFGIMKSLGARDSQVLWLVLLEGLITGLLGAIIATLVSFGLARMISELCRAYIESEIRGKFEQQIFQFNPFDVLIVFAVAGIVCTLASLLPAWRAAKLDPVVAMRRA